MRIVVVIGRVLDPSGIVFNRRRGRMFINREEYLLQPADRCALEAALRIKDVANSEVVAFLRAPLPDDDVLRQALSAGADRAVYLTGEGFRDADDAVMARVLAAAVGRLGGVDLVLTGTATLDAGQGQLGPRLAEALGWSQIVGCWAVETADGRVQAVLKDGTGYVTVEADVPAVVTMLPGTLDLRYPDGVRLINVYRTPDAVEHWDVGDLVDEEMLQPLLEKRGQDFPPERERGVRVSGTPEEMAQALADALRQRVRA
jgi:electron transfer flavoprotein beta subunit